MNKGRWLTVIDDERGSLQLEFWEGLVFLHASFKRKVSAMRAARELFPQLKRWLAEVGHEFSYVYIPVGDEKLHRFEKLFGFRDMCVLNGHIFMAQRN